MLLLLVLLLLVVVVAVALDVAAQLSLLDVALDVAAPLVDSYRKSTRREVTCDTSPSVVSRTILVN